MAKRDSICGEKQHHKSEGAAWAHVRSLKRRFPKEAPRIAYECPYCLAWHVGRPKKKTIDKDTKVHLP